MRVPGGRRRRLWWRVIVGTATAAAAVALLIPAFGSEDEVAVVPTTPGVTTTSGPRFPLGLGPIDRLWSVPEFQSVDGAVAEYVTAAPMVEVRGAFDYSGRPGPDVRDVVRSNDFTLILPPFGGEFTGSATIGWWTVLRRDAPCNTTTEITIDLSGNYDAARGTLSGTFIPVHDHQVLPGCELETVPFADVISRDNFTGRVDADAGLVSGSLGELPFTAAAGGFATSLPGPLQLERIQAGRRGHEAWVALLFTEDWPPAAALDEIIVGAVIPTTEGSASFGFHIRDGVTSLFSGSAAATTWLATAGGVVVGVAQLPDDDIEDTPPTIIVAGRSGGTISEVHRFSASDVPVLTGFAGNPLQVLEDEPRVDIRDVGRYWDEGAVLTDSNPASAQPPTTVPAPEGPPDDPFPWWRIGAATLVLGAGFGLMLVKLGRFRAEPPSPGA